MTGVKAQDNPLFPFAVLAMLAGPGVTGLLLTRLIDGRPGLREFRSRLLTGRVGARWYAVALLAAPLLATAITLTLSLFSPEFLPGIFVTDDKAAVLLLGLVVGLTAGFFEELGWTGFAIPRLKRRYGVLATGLKEIADYSAGCPKYSRVTPVDRRERGIPTRNTSPAAGTSLAASAGYATQHERRHDADLDPLV